MSQIIEVKVPDIGDFSDVPVIDLFVKAGDAIKVDDAICTLESDKATMDVPSTVAGTVREVLVQLGSRVGEGALLIKVETGAAAAEAAPAPAAVPAPVPAAAPAAGGGVVEVKVPDIGDFSDVPVIDLFVKVGDTIKVDDAICTLESDKATMDVPSTAAGVVSEVLVQLGSKVSEGALLIKVETGAGAPATAPAVQAAASAPGAVRPRFLHLRQRRPQPLLQPRLPRRCRSAPRCMRRPPSAPMPANSASTCRASPPPAPRAASSRTT